MVDQTSPARLFRKLGINQNLHPLNQSPNQPNNDIGNFSFEFRVVLNSPPFKKFQLVRAVEKSQRPLDMHFDSDWQNVFIDVEPRVMVRKIGLSVRIARAEKVKGAGHPGGKLRKIFSGQ